MTADATPTQGVVVFDMSSLRFRFGPRRRAMSVLSATGEHLATCPIPSGLDDAGAVFASATAAMSATVLRPVPGVAGPVEHLVALYNPHSAQVSVDLDGQTRWFTPARVPLEAAGTCAELTGTGETRHLVLAGVVMDLESAETDAAAVSRALAAYR